VENECRVQSPRWPSLVCVASSANQCLGSTPETHPRHRRPLHPSSPVSNPRSASYSFLIPWAIFHCPAVVENRLNYHFFINVRAKVAAVRFFSFSNHSLVWPSQQLLHIDAQRDIATQAHRWKLELQGPASPDTGPHPDSAHDTNTPTHLCKDDAVTAGYTFVHTVLSRIRSVAAADAVRADCQGDSAGQLSGIQFRGLGVVQRGSVQ